jgi:hypothetical protein
MKWVQSPAVDLTVGCGAWSLLFVLMAYFFPTSGQTLALGLYTVGVFINAPHYMATIYRAYGTKEDLSRYRVVTVYFTTVLVIALITAHLFYRLIPWLFTIYITWSPWHYMGQNFGLMMMFIHRNGIKVERKERNGMWAAFVASYIMTFITFHTAAPDSPFFLSLGLPARVAATRVPLMAFYLLVGVVILGRMARRVGWKPMIAPVTLYVTEFLWFVMPTALELSTGIRIPQTAYSAGILAVMHCSQYLWITNYYARREATAEVTTWRWQTYFGILILGGMVLFVPGPWLASYAFGRDFTLSGFIFIALINIHHFILDGTIWKLRDTRVRDLLTSSEAAATEKVTPVRAMAARPWRLAAGVAIAMLLLLVGIDQVRYYLGNRLMNTSSMAMAASMNPFDSLIQTRLGRAYAASGDRVRMESSFREALRTDPDNLEAQNAVARLMLESGRFDEAYAHYKEMFEKTEPNAEALMNFGALCRQFNRHDEAMHSFERVLRKLPDYAPAHLLLAELLDADGKTSQAILHYERYASLKSAAPADPIDPQLQSALVRIQELKATRID